MRSNRSIRIGIALIAGAFLLLLLYFIFSGRQNNTAVVNNTTPNGVVPVVASSEPKVAYTLEDIPERSIITPDMFRMEELPTGVASTGYITDRNALVGYITRRRIPNNTRIRMSDLVGHITEVGIAGALRPGTVAMIVPLANKPTFHDLVRVGDSVDIIAAFEQQESRTIVENVRVLAVDVFGKDYPQTSVAVRGDYKAPPRSIRADNPPSPPGNNAPGGTANSAAPAAAQPTPAPGAAPAPEPTPTPTPPPARPAPALTVEVTSEQANRISLAQSSGAAVDFVIRPHESPVVLPGAEARVAAVIKPQLAPYAHSVKNRPQETASDRRARESNKSWERGVDRIATAYERANAPSYSASPDLPSPAGVGTPPAAIGTVDSDTYAIPVYVDGKRIRTDIVRKPRD